MRVSRLIAVVALIAALGAVGLGYLYYQTQEVSAADRQRVESDLRELRRLDNRMSELALRSRYGIDQDYDDLSELPGDIEQKLASLASGPLSSVNVGGTVVESRFRRLRSTLVSKLDALEDFKSHNSILRNSVAFAPESGDKLAGVAERNDLPELAARLRATVRELLGFSLAASTGNGEALTTHINALEGFDQQLPEQHRTESIQLMRHLRTVLEEKPVTTEYLSQMLGMPTIDLIEGVQSSYGALLDGRASASRYFDAALAGYAAVLLAGFLFVVYRLRRLYVTLGQSQEETKAAEQQVIQSEKMASLGQMVAGVAHEINTPLGYVRNNMSLTRETIEDLSGLADDLGRIATEVQSAAEHNGPHEPDPYAGPSALEQRLSSLSDRAASLRNHETLTDMQELLSDAVAGTERISELVQGLKDFSRLDRSKLEGVDVHECIESALTIARHVIKDKAEIERDFDELPTVPGAPSEINQVLLNLLTNAAQAIEGYGLIHISTRSDYDHVHISIRDNGPGIPKDVRERIFDPFYTTKPVGEGTGLGLSICWKIINQHGGHIDVRSRKGEGAEFTVALPRPAEEE